MKATLAQLVACSFLHISYLSTDLHSQTLKFLVALLLLVHAVRSRLLNRRLCVHRLLTTLTIGRYYYRRLPLHPKFVIKVPCLTIYCGRSPPVGAQMRTDGRGRSLRGDCATGVSRRQNARIPRNSRARPVVRPPVRRRGPVRPVSNAACEFGGQI